MVNIIGSAGILISSSSRLVSVTVIVSVAVQRIFEVRSVEHFVYVRLKAGSTIVSSILHYGSDFVNLITVLGVNMNSIFFYFVSIA